MPFGIYLRPVWWIGEIDGILLEQYHESYPLYPFDIDKFKTEIASYTKAYRAKDGTPWTTSLFDIDILISMISDVTGIHISDARRWVLKPQWSDTEPSKYRELGMVCTFGCESDKGDRIYMRVANADKSDKSGIGLPRTGCCGSNEVLVLNPMPKAYATEALDEQARKLYKNAFKEINSDQRKEVLSDVRHHRKALVWHWLSCKEMVREAEAGIGNSTLQLRKTELVDAKKTLDEAGGFFPWNKAYDDMPKVKDDDFS